MCCFADARSVRVFILDWRCFGISKVQHQLNEEITDKEIRLIGENGEQLGIDTPVCKVLSQVVRCIQGNYDKQYLK